GSLLEKGKMTGGIDKAGDGAIVVFDPETHGNNPDQATMALVPTSDFDAFVKNFNNPKEEGGITTAVSPEDGQTVFLAKRGKFAALSQNKDLLDLKAGGLKLS